MVDRSKIEWTDATWSPIRARDRNTGKVGWFCEHASDGCRFCYAEVMNRRLGTGHDYIRQNREKFELFLDERILCAPLRWRSPRRIFVCSMTDLFAEFVPDEWIDRMFAVMAQCEHHTFQILTKRPERMRAYFGTWPMDGRPDRITDLAFYLAVSIRGYRGSGGLAARPLPNVWLGVSVEDQPRADERIQHLRATPAAVRFVSCEPLLGPIHIAPHIGYIGQAFDSREPELIVPHPRIDWVICGGESGPHARPMHPAWARSLRDQCTAAGVPFFLKQRGEWLSEDEAYDLDLHHIKDGPQLNGMYRVGKRRAGALLDGREWRQFPGDVRDD